MLMVHQNSTIHLFCFTQPVGVGMGLFWVREREGGED